MRLSKIFKLKHISNFIQGFYRYYYDKLVGLPNHTKEQILYRITLCKDDCGVNKECIKCGCSFPEKLFNDESCNYDRFPDLMDEEEWTQYKKENNIIIKDE